jgi:RNA polymerase sigma-70 factor, ECF subfamily
VTQTAELATSDSAAPLARSADADLLQRLVDEHYAAVFGMACKFTRCPEKAADATQEAFARALETMGSVDRILHPRSWLIRTARNVCVDDWRARRRHTEMPEEQLADPACDPEGLVMSAAEAAHVRQALDALGERPRRALVMREVEGRSVGEIADQLNVTVGSASVMLHRARFKLRQLCESGVAALLPLGLVERCRRWFETSPLARHGSGVTDGFNTALSLAIALVMSVGPMAAAHELGDATTDAGAVATSQMSGERPVRAAGETGPTSPAREQRGERDGHTAGAGAPPPSRTDGAASGRQDSIASASVPGAGLHVRDERPPREPTVKVGVDEEVLGRRVRIEAEHYADEDDGAEEADSAPAPLELP